MKLNFRLLFVIMPVSVELIFVHMQNTYEDYMTKIQQLSILYQTNHSEFFFLDICFDHSVLPATRACIKRFFHVHQFTFSCHSNSIFNWIVWANSILQRQEKKPDSSDLEIHITWSYDIECDYLNWTVIDMFNKTRHLLINSSSNKYTFWTYKCRA